MRNIKFEALIFAAIVISSLTACQKAENKNAPANQSVAAVNQPVDATTPEADLSGYSLATPSDAYHTAFNARKNCDIPVLKRVMSVDMTAALTQRAESDPKGKKTLDETLKDLCELPQAPNGDIKDEKILNDQATIKYQDEKGIWRLMDFVREKGEWKLTLPRGKGELPALK